MLDILTYLLVFIVLLVPLMIIHELGHYWGAKKAGVRVEEFGLGMPPRAVKLFEHDGTEFTLNWLPFGAFVRMVGEDDPSDPRSLAAAPKRWRLITIAAGPIMNFIGAFLIFTGAYLFAFMRPTEYGFRVMRVNEGSAAAVIGLQPGDLIVSVNGVSMQQKIPAQASNEETLQLSHAPLRESVLAAQGKVATIVVSRPSVPEDLRSPASEVTLRAMLPDNLNPNAPLGISLSYEINKAERAPFTIGQALTRAGEDLVRLVTSIVTLPNEISRRGLTWEQARPTSVIGITQVGVELIENRAVQGLFPFIWFAGAVSFALGFTNLLPLPALDGGRILFILIEWIRGKRIDPVRQQWVHGIGLIMLLCLSAMLMVLDVIRPVIPFR